MDEALDEIKTFAINVDMKDFDKHNFNESQLNLLGYRLLGEGKINQAITIFKMNKNSFPKSANVYDSIAEAYMINCDKEMAIKYSKKVLEVAPNDTNIVVNFREILLNAVKYRLKNGIAEKLLYHYSYVSIYCKTFFMRLCENGGNKYTNEKV